MSAPGNEAALRLRRATEAPHPSGEDRYAIYVRDPGVRCLAETSQDGIGVTIVTLRAEEQITNDDRVGIFDRETRQWIVNPFGKGRQA